MKVIMLFIAVIISSGCDLTDEISTLSKISDSEKVWVFSQFNVREQKEGNQSYYYYGKVSKALVDAIKTNKIKEGFILLENVIYWGDDNLLHAYKDLENTGEIIFRIENIAKINMVHSKPIVGKGSEQFKAKPTKDETPNKNLI